MVSISVVSKQRALLIQRPSIVWQQSRAGWLGGLAVGGVGVGRDGVTCVRVRPCKPERGGDSFQQVFIFGSVF